MKRKRDRERGDCLSRSKLLCNLIIPPLSANFIFIFNDLTCFFKEQKGGTNVSTHQHINQKQKKNVISIFLSTYHVSFQPTLSIQNQKPSVFTQPVKEAAMLQTWSQYVLPPLWIISIRTGVRQMLLSLLLILRGVLMRVQGGVKPVLE